MVQGKETILFIYVPGEAPRQMILEHASYRIGRDSDNDIVLPNKDVSRHHGQLEKNGETWQYTDLNSTNGTIVDGQQLRQWNLIDGMRLQLGKDPKKSVTLIFQIGAKVGGSLLQPNLELVPDAFATIRQERELSTGLVQMQSYQAPFAHQITIGRDPQSDILLKSPVVSRQHAVLRPSGEDWHLIDLNSHNGTSVNGQRIDAPTPLTQNDIVLIGKFRLVYLGEGRLKVYEAIRGLRLDGQGLTCDVCKGKKRKRILENVSISCNPQEFIGLVGGSGAGKTTLMKALSGLWPMEGRVLVEGDDLYHNFDAYRSQIGYVPQDDILHKELTVQQALWYSAKLRLPSDVGDAEIQQRIDTVLEQVELIPNKNQIIRTLSGGQRKRASIAVELLADPPLLFLDEPTSGLDPGLEKRMMVSLRKLADGGKTIVLVTHATANITECDQVAFMSWGRLVFYGPPYQAGEFFQVGSENFADIYSEISDSDPGLAKKKAKKWEERFKLSSFFQKFITERFQALPKRQTDFRTNEHLAKNKTRINFIRQFYFLTRRYFDLIWRDHMLLIILLAIMPLLAGLVLLIAEKNWLVGLPLNEIEQLLLDKLAAGGQSATYTVAGNGQALLLIMALAAVLLGLFAAAYEIVKERTVYERERMVFLRLLPYVASKVLLLASFAALQCLFFLLVIKWKIDFPNHGVFLPALVEIYITLFLGSLAAIMLGLFISTIAPNSNAVAYLILGILFIQILFAGVLFELPGMANNLSKITLTRWTTEALGVSTDLEYLNSLSKTRFEPEPVTQMVTVQENITEEVTVDPDPMDLPMPYNFHLNYTHSANHLFDDWGMLLGLSLLFGTGTLLVLKKKDVV